MDSRILRVMPGFPPLRFSRPEIIGSAIIKMWISQSLADMVTVSPAAGYSSMISVVLVSINVKSVRMIWSLVTFSKRRQSIH